MIVAQLTHLDKKTAKALCLEFILHEYARALDLASKMNRSKNVLLPLDELYPELIDGMPAMKLGALRKLCFYCEALLEKSDKGEKLLNALDELQMLASQERRKRKNTDELYQQLRQLFPLVTEHFDSIQGSEAPLFVLLELRKTLNEHLGQGSIESFLENLFPGGPNSMRQALTEGFSQRGFSGFCKQHQELFRELKWEISNKTP